VSKKWVPTTFTIIIVFQWFNAWNCRSEDKSIFQMNPFSNKFLVGATTIVVLLQILAIYNPFMQGILKTVPLNFSEWIIIMALD
jgi:Ca2+-transporting ATPase